MTNRVGCPGKKIYYRHLTLTHGCNVVSKILQGLGSKRLLKTVFKIFLSEKCLDTIFMFQLIFSSPIIRVLPTNRTNLWPISRTGDQASWSKLNFEVFKWVFKCLVCNLALPVQHFFVHPFLCYFFAYFITNKSTVACQKILMVYNSCKTA